MSRNCLESKVHGAIIVPSVDESGFSSLDHFYHVFMGHRPLKILHDATSHFVSMSPVRPQVSADMKQQRNGNVDERNKYVIMNSIVLLARSLLRHLNALRTPVKDCGCLNLEYRLISTETRNSHLCF